MVVKPCYTDVCEEFCEPSCMSCGLLGGCCDTCGPNHKCSEVKTRKIMVVKLKKSTESAAKRVPMMSASGPVVSDDQGKYWRVRIGRNEFCPCGRGLKWKKCHGKS